MVIGLKSVSSLFSKTQKYVSAYNNGNKRMITSISQTERPLFNGETLVYGPKYDKALNGIKSTLEKEGVSPKFVETYAKDYLREEIKTWGRILDTGKEKQSIFNFAPTPLPRDGKTFYCNDDAVGYAMDITNMERAKYRAKTNSFIAERMKKYPEKFELPEDTAYAKKVLDESFTKTEPNKFDSIVYRGAHISKDDDLYKNLLLLKKGDTYVEPGYLWTSPSREVLSQYGGKHIGFSDKMCVKYNILMPKGSVERRMAGHSLENLTKLNPNFKVHNIVKDENGNLNIFIEHIVGI